MATYYWVGGAGTWDATTTTNWAASSGGSGSAGVPTSADNVIFDTLSNATAYAVTIGTNAVCLDVTIAGPATGNVTITSGATAVINVFGSWTSAATGVVFTTTSGAAINFLDTTTSKTINTNNVTLGNMNIVFGGVGGGWTLGSAITCNGVFTNSGTFNTGNFAMTINSIQRSGTLTAALNLGSSTITCSGSSVVSLNATNFTLNAGTSTIIGSNVTTTFGGAGLTYYNVSFTGSTATITITGANTFNNVTFTTRTTDGIGFINLSASQTINGTLTIGAANTAVRRLCVRSSTVGTQYTLTVATIATLADVDFQDTVAAGASGTWSGTRLGNCTNNSNITFVAGKTVYWNLAGAQSWSAVGWAATSGTAPAVNNFPLAQDTAVFDNTGSVTGTITINASWNIGVLNITKTGAMTLANGTQAPRFFGNVTLQTATVTTGTGAWSYAAYGFSSAFTSNGATFTPPLTINTPTGTLILGDAFTQPSTVITTLTSGTLDLSSYTMTVGFFNSSVATTRTLAFGTGKIVVTGSSANVCQTSTGTNLTVTGSKRIELSYSGSTGTRVILGATTSTAIEGVNILDYYITAGTDTVILSGSRTYGNIDFSNGGTSTFTGTWQNATNTVVIYGNLILKSGMVVGSGTNSVSLQATSGTKTITTAGQTIDFQLNFNGIGGTWAFQDALTMGPLETSIIIFTSGTIQFKAGTTNTVLDFFTTGTTQKYLQSTIPGTQATISQTTGDNSVSYLTIQDNNATGGATWNASASTNIDAGNNTGWTFGNIQSLYSGMLPTFGFGFRI